MDMAPSAKLRAAFAQPIVLDSEAHYLANAFHLGRIARLVYSIDGDIDEDESKLTAPERDAYEAAFPVSRIISRGRIEGLVAGNDAHAVVAFRGIETAGDWMGHLAFGKVPGIVGHVHEGIALAVDSVWPEVLAGLYDAGAPDRTLWVTGHSLGGAMAAVAAERLYEEGFEPLMTATFGAPPIFDEVAAAAFAPRMYRFVNDEDAAPGLSWPRMSSAYRHAGEEVRLTTSGRVAASRHSDWVARRIDRAMRIGEGPTHSGPWRDHLMTAYLEKVWQALELERTVEQP